MNELTLQWREGDQLKAQTIGDQYPSRQNGVFRIGRDPARCDLVFQDRSVSGLHVEIFWQQGQFYIRGLRPANPPHIDQVPLVQGDQLLHTGSRICLGRVELTVMTITVPTVQAPSPPQSASGSAYGIKCPNVSCGAVLPYTPESFQRGCPHCGSQLAAGVTVGPFKV